MSDDAASNEPAGATSARPLRSRAMAALMAFFVPGLGHAYLGRPGRGLAWAAAPVLVTLLMAVAGQELGPRQLALFAAVTVVLWLGAIGDPLVVDHAPERYPGGMRVALMALVLFVGSRANALLLRSLVLEPFQVPAGSMIPTLRIGDHFFADKAAYRRRAPRRGELAVFRSPESPEPIFVKRVLGVGGDRIEVTGGRVRINGWEVPRCDAGKWRYDADGSAHEGTLFVEFIEDAAYLVFHEDGAPGREPQAPYDVPDGQFFLLGDNRDNSHDSRAASGGQGGAVPRDKLLGRAGVVWLSEAESGRIGVDPAAVAMPAGSEHGLIEACLARRPSREQATPPRR